MKQRIETVLEKLQEKGRPLHGGGVQVRMAEHFGITRQRVQQVVRDWERHAR